MDGVPKEGPGDPPSEYLLYPLGGDTGTSPGWGSPEGVPKVPHPRDGGGGYHYPIPPIRGIPLMTTLDLLNAHIGI